MIFFFSTLKMTPRSQKRKIIAELVSGAFEASAAENIQPGKLVVGPSNSPRIQPEKLDGIKTSPRKGIISDLTKIVAENQKEILNLRAPVIKKRNLQSTKLLKISTLKWKITFLHLHQHL